MNETLNRYLSKKYSLSLMALVSAHWLMMSGDIADGVYSAVLIATVAAFICGDVFEKKVTQ